MTTIEDPDVPDGLVELLRDFTLAVLRHKPRDLHQFASEYFNHAVRGNANVVSAQPRSQPVPMYVVVEDNDDVTESPRQPIMKKDGNRFKRRQSVCGESYNPEDDTASDESVVYPKTDEQRQRLALAVGCILLFRCLDEEQTHAVIDAMFEMKVQTGYHVIEQGDDGDNFYVIQSGRYDVMQRQNNGEMKLVHQFVDKGCFGELALMYNMPRSATIVAATDGILWAMERSAFRRIVLRSAYLKRKTYDSFLQSVPMLSSLDSYERLNIADALVSKSFDPGQCIIREGEAADGMYFIEDGEVKVTIKKSGREMEVKKLSQGMYFGEMALVENSPRSASVYAINSKVKVAFLERESFERLLGPCMNIMKRTMITYQYSS